MMSKCPQCGSKECCGGDMQVELEALRAQVAEVKRWKEDAVVMCAKRQCGNRDKRIADLEAQLADCQALIIRKGHDEDCPARYCVNCTLSLSAHDWDIVTCAGFQPSPCSDTCGVARTTGEQK